MQFLGGLEVTVGDERSSTMLGEREGTMLEEFERETRARSISCSSLGNRDSDGSSRCLGGSIVAKWEFSGLCIQMQACIE
jgi:hypothetical protein